MQRTVKAFVVFAAAVGASVLGATEQAAAQQLPPITVQSLDYEGKGCPNGSVTALPLSSDARGQALPIKLNEYESYVTPSSRYMTVDCKLTLTLNVPAGITTALSSISYFGFADLEQGVTTNFNATYTWAGLPVPTRSADIKALSGPQDNVPFTWKDTVSTPSWSRCGGQQKLTLTTGLTVLNSTNPARNGSVKLDRTDVDVASALVVAFDAKRCS